MAMWMTRRRPLPFRFTKSIAIRGSAHAYDEDARTAEMAGI